MRHKTITGNGRCRNISQQWEQFCENMKLQFLDCIMMKVIGTNNLNVIERAYISLTYIEQ